jgi:ferric enterobactin receptor
MPILSTPSNDKNHFRSQKLPRLATSQALLSIAIASILSTTAVAAENDVTQTTDEQSLDEQSLDKQSLDKQAALPSTTLDTIVVRAARDELVQAPSQSPLHQSPIDPALVPTHP